MVVILTNQSFVISLPFSESEYSADFKFYMNASYKASATIKVLPPMKIISDSAAFVRA
jgi:hypothetical protein